MMTALVNGPSGMAAKPVPAMAPQSWPMTTSFSVPPAAERNAVPSISQSRIAARPLAEFSTAAALITLQLDILCHTVRPRSATRR